MLMYSSQLGFHYKPAINVLTWFFFFFLLLLLFVSMHLCWIKTRQSEGKVGRWFLMLTHLTILFMQVKQNGGAPRSTAKRGRNAVSQVSPNFNWRFSQLPPEQALLVMWEGCKSKYTVTVYKLLPFFFKNADLLSTSRWAQSSAEVIIFLCVRSH